MLSSSRNRRPNGPLLDEHHRLVDQPGKQVVDVDRLEVAAGSDRLGRDQVERSDEP